jgi:heme-degrading monooxygenase HmoA
MFAVIFRAKIKELDSSYFETAKRMRDLAFEKYGCLDFVSLSENGDEVAISYWPSLEAIKDWRNDIEHKSAQRKGSEIWYLSYKVGVVEVLRSYASE